MVTPSQLTVLITAIGYPCRTYTMSNTHRNPQLSKAFDKLEPIKRNDALKKVVKNKNKDRVMLSITYDPRVADYRRGFKGGPGGWRHPPVKIRGCEGPPCVPTPLIDHQEVQGTPL